MEIERQEAVQKHEELRSAFLAREVIQADDHIRDEDGGLWPVAFFNNDWWLLTVENGEAMSRGDWRILQGRYGLGWWTINDPQHLDHKQLELISPREPKLEVPSDEEEKEFHPANPPRGIEVEESPVEETAP